MRLSDLWQDLPGLILGADPNLEVQSVAYDSRRIAPGGLFFAIEGEKADGHRFVAQAFERGAVAVASERTSPPGLENSWVRVPAIRPALSSAARAFYEHPERSLKLAGITGTNGKTTTAFLLESILRAAGVEAGLFGTIEYRVAGQVLPAPNTTPESLDLAAYLADLRRANASAAIMEVSSHALAQERVWGFPFSVAVFTNLTRDHLDYHGTMDDYFRAKRRLFEGLGTAPPEVAVINVDDAWGAKLLEINYPRLITYGAHSEASVRPKRVLQDATGLKIAAATPAGAFDVSSGLVGQPNVMNILAAIAAAQGLGISNDAIQMGVHELGAVPGRFQRIEQGQPFLVIVDYAHTDDALRNVLTTARELTRNRLIVVFGCGGDRDRSKRAPMGEVAGSLADVVVLTSDNPRSEDPLIIMNDVLVGIQRTGKPCTLEVDREAAIRRALLQAHPGDVVVIAGKGHESYQIFKDRTVAFDDREVARRLLDEQRYTRSGPAASN
jgi:UDP-N-acetylmuramoyl-L-alanyl-D-glutamate--2,6-diaminopimelate ligase